MTIKILCFNQETNMVDFQVDYSENKWERFRDVRFIKKEDGRKWLNVWSSKRDEKFIPKYERSPPLSKLFAEVLKVLEQDYDV